MSAKGAIKVRATSDCEIDPSAIGVSLTFLRDLGWDLPASIFKKR